MRGYVSFIKNLHLYNKMNHRESFARKWGWDFRCLVDKYEQAGQFGSYFWQDLWAARLIYENKPDSHFDIGSRIDGFIGHLASFGCPTTLIDIRPLESNIPNVDYVCADATSLSGVADASLGSISALCSLEHFGLGRYGDPIDPEACFKAMASIRRVLKPGGHLYLAVPIGYEHLEYNAHRIFFAETIVDQFRDLQLVELSAATDEGIIYNIDVHQYDGDKYNRGRVFGLFHFLNS